MNDVVRKLPHGITSDLLSDGLAVRIRGSRHLIELGVSFEKIMLQFDPRWQHEDGNLRVTEDLANEILTKAKNDFEFYQIAKDLAQSYMSSREPMPDSLHDFVAKILDCEHKKPRGKKSDSNFFRDMLICMNIERFVEILEIKEYTSQHRKESGPNNDSISVLDIVAEGFKKAGFGMVTYTTVENVWKNRVRSGLARRIERYRQASVLRVQFEIESDNVGKT